METIKDGNNNESSELRGGRAETFHAHSCAEDISFVDEVLNFKLTQIDAQALHILLNKILLKPVMTGCRNIMRVGKYYKRIH